MGFEGYWRDCRYITAGPVLEPAAVEDVDPVDPPQDPVEPDLPAPVAGPEPEVQPEPVQEPVDAEPVVDDALLGENPYEERDIVNDWVERGIPPQVWLYPFSIVVVANIIRFK